MPEGVSNERVFIIRAYGGDVSFTPKDGGIRRAIAEVVRMGEKYHVPMPVYKKIADELKER